MKKYLFVLVLLSLVVMVSGCTSTQTVSTKNFTASGMSFYYPDTWNVTSQIGENATQILVANKEFFSSNMTKGCFVYIVKVNNSTSNDAIQLNNSFYSHMQQFGNNTTNGTVTVDGLNASELKYVGNDSSGKQLYLKLINFDVNNTYYALEFQSRDVADEYSVRASFDVILNNFKVS